MIDKYSIGKIIQLKRKEQNLTQDELAEKVDISPNYLSKVERGLSILNTETFLKMAEVLSFTLNDFGINVKSNQNISNTKSTLIKKILSASEQEVELYAKAIEFTDEISKSK